MTNIYALLIGIDDYDDRVRNNIRYGKLGGCVRDIDHVYEYLRSDLRVPDDQIIRLTAPLAGKGEPAGASPTYAGIVGGFNQLLSLAREPGDSVYIHYSGHGGRARTDKPELKQGFLYDETLVPVDIGSEEGIYLRDYELNLIMKKLVDKGLEVTAVFDCCHSGGANRGDAVARGLDETDEGERPSGSLVGTDAEIEAAWTGSVGEARGVEFEEYNWLTNPLNYTFIAACRPNEKAYEYAFTGTERNGALTYYWLDTLRKAPANAAHKMVMDRVISCVHGVFAAQSPMLQGVADKVLFGEEVRSRRSSIGVLSRQQGSNEVRLGAGAAHGIETGTEVQLFKFDADLDNPDARSADGVVESVMALESMARITATVGDGEIEAGDLALIPGASSIKLQLPVKLLDGVDKARVAQAIADRGKGFVVVASDGEAAELLVGPVEKQEGIHILDCADVPLAGVPPIAALDDDGIDTLVKRLVHIAKFRHVQRLAPATANASTLLQVSIDGEEGVSAHRGPEQNVGIRIKNTLPAGASANQNNIEVTVFSLSSDWSITLLPMPGGATTIAPGEDRVLGLITYLPESMTQSTDVIKVFATRNPSSFEWLQLNPLDEGDRSVEKSARSGERSTFDVLFDRWEADEVEVGTRHTRVASPPEEEWSTAQVEIVVAL
jgi:hypothetical protein